MAGFNTGGGFNAPLSIAGLNASNLGSIPVDTSLYLDSLMSSGLISGGKSQLVLCVDRAYPGFIGPTLRLKRVADSATSSFGCTADGRFDHSTAIAWANSNGGNANLDAMFSQEGAGLTFNVNSIGTIPFIESGAITRHASSRSTSTSALTLSTSQGACGAKILASNTAFLECVTSNISATNGIEITILGTHLQRKAISGNVATDPLGANSTQEAFFSLGTAANRSMTLRGPSTNLLQNAIDPSGAGGVSHTSSGGSGSMKMMKQYAQFVFTQRLATISRDDAVYGWGEQLSTVTLNAANTATVLNTALANGRIRIGSRWGSGSTGTDYGNFLFYGLIITTELTALERTALQLRGVAALNHHLTKTKAQIEDYFDEYLLFKDTNPTTGVCAGKKSKTSYQFNVSTGSPTWDLAYTDAINGLQGVRNPDELNNDNTFEATNNYFAQQYTGAIAALYGAEYQDLYTLFGVSTDANDADALSVELGRDHSSMRGITNSTATVSLTHNYRSGGISNVSGFTDSSGGNGAQTAKYPDKWYGWLGGYDFPKASTVTITMTDGTSIPSGTTFTNANLTDEATAVSAYGTWTHFGPPTPEYSNYSNVTINLTPGDVSTGTLTFGTVAFDKGSLYNHADADTTKVNFRQTGQKWLYQGRGPLLPGHRDNTVAGHASKACVPDQLSTAKIRSCKIRAATQARAAHYGHFFMTTMPTEQQVLEVQVNMARLLDLVNV